jgi:hypothetical protein
MQQLQISSRWGRTPGGPATIVRNSHSLFSLEHKRGFPVPTDRPPCFSLFFNSQEIQQMPMPQAFSAFACFLSLFFSKITLFQGK